MRPAAGRPPPTEDRHETQLNHPGACDARRLGGFAIVAQGADVPTSRCSPRAARSQAPQASATEYGYKSGAYDVIRWIKAVPNLDKLAVITGEQVANIGSRT